MRTSLVAARGLVLAMLGLGAGSALGQNVTAFDPYDGTGLPGGAAGRPGTGAYAPAQQPPSGPAFNPWNPNDVQAGRSAPQPRGVLAVPYGQVPQAVGTHGVPYYERGPDLPQPPPDALHSRLTAYPEKGDPTAAPRGRNTTPRMATGQPAPLTHTEAPPPAAAATPPPPAPATPQPVPIQPTTAQPAPAAPTPQAAPPPAPAVTTATLAPPASAPAAAPPAAAPPVATAPAASVPMPAAASPRNTTAVPAAPATPPAASASTAPEPPPPAPVPPTASVLFAMDSAEINEAAKSELDRIAKGANARGLKQIELRAYAGGSDLVESRKVALARALAVRSYLIDQGVKSRIEVGTFGPATRGAGPSERVDLVAPGI